MAEQKIIRLPEALRRTGLSRSTVYVYIRAGRFPQPISIGTRAIGFLATEIDRWIDERIAQSRSGDDR